MPRYDFKCVKCELEFEKDAKIDERKDVKCPVCEGDTEVLVTCIPPKSVTWSTWRVN